MSKCDSKDQQSSRTASATGVIEEPERNKRRCTTSNFTPAWPTTKYLLPWLFVFHSHSIKIMFLFFFFFVALDFMIRWVPYPYGKKGKTILMSIYWWMRNPISVPFNIRQPETFMSTEWTAFTIVCYLIPFFPFCMLLGLFVRYTSLDDYAIPNRKLADYWLTSLVRQLQLQKKGQG